MNFGSGNFTINIFLKPNSTQTGGNFPGLIHKSTGDWTYPQGTGGVRGWILFWISDRYYFMLGNGDTSPNIISFPTTVTNDNNWKNLSVVVSTNTIEIFNNSISLGSINRTKIGSTDTTQNMFLSMWNTNQFNNPTNRYLRDNIGSVQLYNRSLTSTEISQNYNALKSRFGL